MSEVQETETPQTKATTVKVKVLSIVYRDTDLQLHEVVLSDTGEKVTKSTAKEFIEKHLPELTEKGETISKVLSISKERQELELDTKTINEFLSKGAN